MENKISYSMDSKEFKENPFDNAPFEIEAEYKYAVIYDQRLSADKKATRYGQAEYFKTSKEANNRASELPRIQNKFYFNVGIRKRI